MPGTPEVTVVIPTRDRWAFLGLALRSALAQREVALEVVIVDDGSAVEMPPALALGRDARVRVVRHERARGAAAARNRGIAEAQAPWVAFLDDDDLWAPSKLGAQLAAIEVADASFGYCGAVLIDEGGAVMLVQSPPDPARLLHALLSFNAIPAASSNVVARTDLVREVGLFDESLLHLTDWDLWLRLAEVAPAAAAPAPLVGYLQHTPNMLTRAGQDVLDELGRLAVKHRVLSRALGVDFDGGALARWAANGHRRAGRRQLAVRTYLRGAIDFRDPSLLRGLGGMLLEAAGARRRPSTPTAGRPAWLDLYPRRGAT